MREILFRGKFSDNGNWIEGSLIVGRDLESGELIYLISPLSAYYTEVKKVIPETIGQYTGLTDKNGKKIFEGDIVKDTDYKYLHLVKYFGYENYPAFDCEPFVQFCDCNGLSHLANNYAVEVIGNIHDNPELLKVDKNEI